MAEKIVGILGGMGMEATADLFTKIFRATPVRTEQDHLRIVIDNNPKIPDRTQAILSGRTAEVIALLQETARNVERSGADFIVMPCNTAHYFFSRIEEAVSIPVVNMVEETVRRLREVIPSVRKVGLLATTGTVKAGVYEKVLSSGGIATLVPDGTDQDAVFDAVMAIKEEAGHARAKEVLRGIAGRLVERGAEAIIAGCTEIPLALTQEDVSVPFFDSTEILAKTAVRMAKEETP
jgi:aspartate racemase